MIIIGEKLNSSIPKTFLLMKENDEAGIKSLACNQVDAGADYLDINTAIFMENELEKMKWVLDIVLSNTDCGIMIDSTNPAVVIEALKYIKEVKGKRDIRIIINSVTLSSRINELLPVIQEYKTGVVALPIDESGTPRNAEARAANALKLIEILTTNGVEKKNIYIDVLSEAVATDDKAPKATIDTVLELRRNDKEVHIVCGLSNVSFGLPKRQLINAAFVSVLAYAGLDSVIIDITCENTKNAVYAAALIAGDDEFCMEYITCIRKA